jgi:hypothetical protein
MAYPKPRNRLPIIPRPLVHSVSNSPK